MELSYIEKEKVHFYTIVLMVYFLIAPLEDVLTGQGGTLAKYLTIVLIVAIIIGTRGRISIKCDSTNVSILLLLTISIVGVIWAIDKNYAISKLYMYIAFPVIFLLIRCIDFSRKERLIIRVAIVLSIGLVAISLMQNPYYLSGSNMLRLTLNERNDPNNFIALLILPMAVSLKLAYDQKVWKKVLGIVVIAIICIITFFSGSRGGLLGIVGCFLSYIAVSKRGKKPLFFIMAFAAIFIFVQYILPILPSDYANRLFSMSNYIGQDATGAGRVGLWKVALGKVFPQYFPIGTGTACASIAMNDYVHYEAAVHNTYFFILVEFGIFGIVPFVNFLVSVLKKLKNQENYTEFAALCGMMIIIFFLDAYRKKFFWNILFYCALII